MIIAEDLGTVPDFVRASLARLGVPGFRVLRWERHWHSEGQPFRDPAEYPAISVATSGTHDTESMAVWWEHASAAEREQIAALPTVQRIAGPGDLTGTRLQSGRARRAARGAVRLPDRTSLLLPLIDVFGWSDRINEPATIGGDNWTFRLPWPSDRLHEIPEARERQEALNRWTRQYRR